MDGKDNGEEGGDGLLDGLRDYRFLSVGLCNRVFEQLKLKNTTKQATTKAKKKTDSQGTLSLSNSNN